MSKAFMAEPISYHNPIVLNIESATPQSFRNIPYSPTH